MTTIDPDPPLKPEGAEPPADTAGEQSETPESDDAA